MKKTFNRFLSAALDLLLPRACIICGRKLYLQEKHICLHCQADFPYTYFWNQSHNPMADRFNDILHREGSSHPHERYAYAAALFFYSGDNGYSNITQQIKYNGDQAAGKHFGNILGRHLATSESFNDADLIIPVPLHWRRHWKRGYNQAEVIASAIAECLRVPLRTDIIKRSRMTQSQTKLNIEEKGKNVAGAFQPHEGLTDIENIRHIILVDDVFTTGSTLHACFCALRTVLPSSVRISVVALGFVGEA